MLIYTSVMFAFRSAAGRNVPERTALLERLAPAPEVVVDGLLARFTETPRGSTKYVGYFFHDILTLGSCRGL
jgi:DNA-directed RNA polymerase I subunit RPA49